MALTFGPVFGVQRQWCLACECGQPFDARLSTGRALVVLRFAIGHRLGIGATGGITAFRALRLWQQVVEAVSERG
jgi:hypothetical protein